MTIYLKGQCKDGKINVRYAFNNGVVLNKIYTPAKVEEEIQKIQPDFKLTGANVNWFSITR